jgi:hypothetical protein
MPNSSASARVTPSRQIRNSGFARARLLRRGRCRPYLGRFGEPLASVYIGICNRDYSFLQLMLEARASIDAYPNVGSSLCIAANRISYFFNLLGPSLAVDTACSSSLVPQPGRVDFRRSRPV